MKKYTFCLYVGTVNGKRVNKKITADTQKELNNKVAEARMELAQGKDIHSKALFGAWADEWYRVKKEPSGKTYGTLVQYQSAIKQLKKRFEFVSLKDITLSDMQCFVNDLAKKNPNTGKPMAKATINNIVKTANAIFDFARANKIAGVPIFNRIIEIPKSAPKRKTDALTEQEIEMIINTPHRAQLPAMIMLFAGLRREEMAGLMWKDIDLKKGTINICRSVVMNMPGGKSEIKDGGKTDNATRIVKIPPILVDYLTRTRADLKVLSQYVCLSAQGHIHTKSSCDKMWQSYMIDLNVKYGYNDNTSKFSPAELPMKIKPFRMHQLRHTFATMLFLQGVDIQIAKQYLGHGNISVTSDIYTDFKQSNISISDEYRRKLNTEYRIA